MIALILGTKAELIKTMPVMRELEKRGVEYKFIHTGQHTISDLVEDFGVKSPDVVLYEPPKKSSRFMVKTYKALFWNLPLIMKINSELKNIENLKYVLYHGDTMSSAAGAIASSSFLNPGKPWKNGHLEAGLRSNDLFEPFPEEISRRICDNFSDILFAVSKGTVKNLRREGQRGKIVNVGNTIIDAAYISLNLAMKKYGKMKKKNYCLINIHRHENIKSRDRMEKVVEIVENVKVPAYWPMHDNTRNQLVKFGLMKRLERKKNIKLSKLVSYIEFIRILANSKYLITDGGSIQEESLAYKKPCLLLRKKTERDEGLVSGINYLTGLDANKAGCIIRMLEDSNFRAPRFKNPYGKGDSAKKIVDMLVSK